MRAPPRQQPACLVPQRAAALPCLRGCWPHPKHWPSGAPPATPPPPLPLPLRRPFLVVPAAPPPLETRASSLAALVAKRDQATAEEAAAQAAAAAAAAAKAEAEAKAAAEAQDEADKASTSGAAAGGAVKLSARGSRASTTVGGPRAAAKGGAR